MSNITENELLDALREAMLPTVGSEDGVTVPELCERLCRSRAVVARAIRALIAEGRAEHVKVMRMQMNNVPKRTDAYRLK